MNHNKKERPPLCKRNNAEAAVYGFDGGTADADDARTHTRTNANMRQHTHARKTLDDLISRRRECVGKGGTGQVLSVCRLIHSMH